ncbi:hypothetical protein AGMMS4956_06830 [Bacteroidia bacterium]|nr:hypothetical protein AGMMS4956_06830 [Bacteroidia bacterium]
MYFNKLHHFIEEIKFLNNIIIQPNEERILLADSSQYEHLQVQVAANARLTLVVQRDQGYTLTHHFELSENSHCRLFYIYRGKNLVNQQINVTFAGCGAVCEVWGLCEASGAAQVQTTTYVEHNAPHCSSRQLFKAIADDEAQVLFDGKIVVAAHADKTEATQVNKNILLNGAARASAQPQLEIYARDVKCSHGATVGQLDAEALFYLCSRGIPQPQARQMLLDSFMQEVFEQLRIESGELRIESGELRVEN